MTKKLIIGIFIAGYVAGLVSYVAFEQLSDEPAPRNESAVTVEHNEETVVPQTESTPPVKRELTAETVKKMPAEKKVAAPPPANPVKPDTAQNAVTDSIGTGPAETDSVAREELAVPDSIGETTAGQTAPADSIMTDSTITTIEIQNEEITIRKEILLGSYRAALLNADTTDNDTAGSGAENDSLMMETGDIKEIRPMLFTIEYWQSPVNFSGYKFGNNILVVYGLSPDKNSRIIKLNDVYYLKNFNDYYFIKETFDYLPLLKVQEEYILVQLKQL